MEVYDQTEFIQNRDKKIKDIKNQSKQINEIAISIHDKVIEQDHKLDDLDKELGHNVSFLKAANENLMEAEQKTSTGNKCKCQVLVFLLILMIVIGITVYFKFFYQSEEKKVEPTPEPKPDNSPSTRLLLTDSHLTGDILKAIFALIKF